MVDDNGGVFITSMKIILSKFFHFPEIHLNINLIILSLTNNLKQSEELFLFIVAEKFDFAALKDNFQIFRGKFRGISRLIGISHLNILKNFITFDIHASNSLTNIEIMGKLVVYCFRAYYKVTDTYKNRFFDFQKKKLVEIEIQDICVHIAFYLTKSKKICRILMESEFYDDLIDYIIILATGYNEERENDHEISGVSQIDFVEKILQKKKKDKLDDLTKKTIERIIKNSVGIVLNLYRTGDNSIVSDFDKKVLF